VPIYRATKSFVSLQILQSVSVVWKCFRNFEGTYPKGFEFTMLSLVLSGCIPFEDQISQLEILLISLPVKGLLDFLLTVMRSIHKMLSFLLHFYQLMYPSDHVIRLFVASLGRILPQAGQAGKEKLLQSRIQVGKERCPGTSLLSLYHPIEKI
jgi:hypothetical protein